jgi:hypothetical protein
MKKSIAVGVAVGAVALLVSSVGATAPKLPKRWRVTAVYTHTHQGEVAVVAAAVLLTGSAADASDRTPTRLPDRAHVQVDRDRAQASALGKCTMAELQTRATVEVQVANAPDFCELISQALANSVFHASVLVTPGWLWHYTNASLSCRLQYRHSSYRITVHNSAATCRWLKRLAAGWHPESAAFAPRAAAGWSP